ncbi:MAG TPA: hypothetical protein DCE42_22485 [Myxococcales bacterium]|nr:hypothetical protein [Myxococcales bacterium]
MNAGGIFVLLDKFIRVYLWKIHKESYKSNNKAILFREKICYKRDSSSKTRPSSVYILHLHCSRTYKTTKKVHVMTKNKWSIAVSICLTLFTLSGCVPKEVIERRAKLKRLQVQLRAPNWKQRVSASRELQKMDASLDKKIIPQIIDQYMRERGRGALRGFQYTFQRYGARAVPYYLNAFAKYKGWQLRTFYRMIYKAGPEAEPHVLQACKSKQVRERRACFYAISLLRGFSTARLNTLYKGLKDKGPGARRLSAQALGHIARSLIKKDETLAEKHVPEIVLALGNSLSDPNERVQKGVLRALGEIGPRADKALPKLEKLLTNQKLAGAAIYAIRKIGIVTPTIQTFLLKCLETCKRGTRSAALGMIRALGPQLKGLVPYFRKRLGFADSGARMDAAMMLSYMGPAATPALPDLIRVLSDKSRYFRRYVIKAIGRIGKAALPFIKKKWAKGNQTDRLQLLQVMENMGPEVAELTKELEEALMSSHRRTRSKAMRVLAKMGPPALPVVTRVLRLSTDKKTQRQLLYLLGNVGKDSTLAATTAISFLNSDVSYLKYSALRAIAKIGPKASIAVPKLQTMMLAPQKARLTRYLYEAIAGIGKGAAPLAPLLIQKLNQSGRRNRRQLLKAIGSLGEAASGALPNLTQMLQSSRPRYVREIIKALGNMGLPAASVLAEYIEKAKGRYESLFAVKTLRKFVPDAVQIIPALTKALSNSYYQVQEAALALLVQFGIKAKGALPKIKPFLKSRNPKLRKLANKAVEIMKD